MTEENIVRNAVLSNASIATSGVRDQKATYFILAVLGLSFWFFLGLPFASHRETYAWLAGVQTESLAQQFSFGLSSTYRPLSQVVTRAGFLILDATVFPTSVLRQTFLQAFVYAMFILAWWLIYSVASFPRLFAAVALVCGGVFFSGYVHLFHIYGMFYVPVILTLGILIRLHALGTFENTRFVSRLSRLYWRSGTLSPPLFTVVFTLAFASRHSMSAVEFAESSRL